MPIRCAAIFCPNHKASYSVAEAKIFFPHKVCTIPTCGSQLERFAPVVVVPATTKPFSARRMKVQAARPEQLYYGPQPYAAYKAAVLAAKPKEVRQETVVDPMEVMWERADAFHRQEELDILNAKKKAAAKAAFLRREAKRQLRAIKAKAVAAAASMRVAIRKERIKKLKHGASKKRLAAKKALAAAELASRRAAGLTRKSALRRSLKKKKNATTVAGRKVPKTSYSQFPGYNFWSSPCFMETPLPPFVRGNEEPVQAINVPHPHPEGDELEVPSNFVPPIVGEISSLPFMGPVVEAFNRLRAPLCAVNMPAAQDLYKHVLELATFDDFFALRRKFVGEALSWLALIVPLYPYQGLFDSYLPIDLVPDEKCESYLASLKYTAISILQMEQSPLEVHSMFDRMKELGAKVRQIKDSVCTYVAESFHSVVDKVLDVAKGFFFKLLDPYFARVQRIGDEIKNFWSNCVLWAKKMWQGTHIALQALGIYGAWAIVTMILVGIMYVIETILISLGCLGSHGILVVALTGMIMAWLGFSIFQMGRSWVDFLSSLRKIIFMATLPDSGLTDVDLRDEGSDFQQVHSVLDTAMAPVHFCESIASGLTFFSSSSITVLGKLGNSMEGIRKGFNCLRDFTSVLLEQFGNAFEFVSGKRTTFFRDLSCAVKIDIERWTRDARKSIEYFEIAGSLDKFEFYKLRVLIYQGQEMIDVANKAGSSHTSTRFLRTVGKLVDEMKEVRAKCVRSLKFPGWRRQPFWVYIYGASQCGKSTLANYLTPQLLSHCGWDPQDAYSKDPVDGYWSGYYQQKALKINDLSSVNAQGTVPIEQQLIALISTEEKTVSTAEIEGKGMQFASEIVVSSSNVVDAPTGAEILDADAYRLRRKVLMRCRRAVEWVHNEDGTRTERVDEDGNFVYKPYDPSNALACTEVQWVNAKTFTPLAGKEGQWHLAEFTTQMVKDEMDRHWVVEDQKMSGWRDSLGMRSTTAKRMTTYLQKMMTNLSTFVSVKGGNSEDIRKNLVAVDGQAYELDSAGRARKLDKYDAVEELERMTRMHYRLSFADALLTHAAGDYDDSFHASTVREFMTALVEDGSCVLSVDKLASSTQEVHQELWAELGLTERIFLRVTQLVHNQIRDAPHFKDDISTIFLDSVRKVRDLVVDKKEQLLFFFAAVALVGLFGWGFMSLLKHFATGALGFGASVALREQMTHSAVMSSGSVTSAFAHRNMPIVWGQVARYSRVHSGKEFDIFRDGYAHLLARIIGVGGQSETCVLFGHTAVVLCAHQVAMFADNESVQIHYFNKERKESCLSFTFHKENVIERADHEVVIYRDAQLTPLPVYSDNMYLSDDQSLPDVTNVVGVSIKKRKFFEEGTLSVADSLLGADEPIVRSWSDIARLCTQEQTLVGPGYSRKVNRYYTSGYPSGVHDSGGIVTMMVNNVRKVVGLHCAGIKIGKNYKCTIGLLPCRNFADVHTSVDYFLPSGGIETPGYRKIGWIGEPTKRPHTSAKTVLAPVPENLALPLPEGVVTKIPSILSKKDPRLQSVVNPEHKDYDPLKVGMEKFANPMAVLDDDILTRVCDDIFDTWYDCLDTFEGEKVLLQKTTLHVALNGVPGDACYEAMRLDTSEGYPYVLERKQGDSGKARYVNIDDNGVRTLIPETSVERDYRFLSKSILESVPVLNCIECPKDELLKPSKVLEKPGTRLFDVLPFVHNILLREYFLNFCVFLQEHRHVLPCSVGINPYSREWTWLYDRLARVSDKALNCDYSKFDGLISHQVYMHMVRIINRMFSDGDEANRARRNLFLMFTSRRSIAFDQVYMVRGGMPSGCALTVIINSILNEILVRYVYRLVVPVPTKNYFNEYVELVVYGDDNLIAIHDDVLPYFDGPIIKRQLALVGVTITDGTDKLSTTLQRKPLLELDFLKRGFRKIEGGLFACPLDKGSLYSRLYFSTGGPGGVYQLDILHSNIKSFLEELTHHDNHYEEFLRVRDFYVSRIPSWSATLPTYATCLDMMEAQRNAAIPWQPHRFIETRPNGGEEQMMAGQDDHAGIIQVTPRLAICGPHHLVENKMTSFVVAIDCNLQADEKGVRIATEFGSGRGRLPTERWAMSFRSPKARKELYDAYMDGMSIYFRSRMPYCNAWCALGMFAQAHGISAQHIISMYETVKPTHGGDIAPLIAVKEFKRYCNRPRFNFGSVHNMVA